MERKHNTTVDGKEWHDETKKVVWQKAKKIPLYDEQIWRRDRCGLVINFFEFGNRNIDLGWEIDHIQPISAGGTDDLDNLQALNWNSNNDKNDKLDWDCNKVED